MFYKTFKDLQQQYLQTLRYEDIQLCYQLFFYHLWSDTLTVDGVTCAVSH